LNIFTPVATEAGTDSQSENIFNLQFLVFLLTKNNSCENRKQMMLQKYGLFKTETPHTRSHDVC